MHVCNPAVPAQTKGRMNKGAKRGKLECFIVLLMLWLHFDGPSYSFNIFNIIYAYYIHSFIHSLQTTELILQSAMVELRLHTYLIMSKDLNTDLVAGSRNCLERETSASLCETTHDNGWVTLMLLAISSKAPTATCVNFWFPLSTSTVLTISQSVIKVIAIKINRKSNKTD